MEYIEFVLYILLSNIPSEFKEIQIRQILYLSANLLVIWIMPGFSLVDSKHFRISAKSNANRVLLPELILCSEFIFSKCIIASGM